MYENERYRWETSGRDVATDRYFYKIELDLLWLWRWTGYGCLAPEDLDVVDKLVVGSLREGFYRAWPELFMVVSLIQSDLIRFVHDPGLSAINAWGRQLSCEGAARCTGK